MASEQERVETIKMVGQLAAELTTDDLPERMSQVRVSPVPVDNGFGQFMDCTAEDEESADGPLDKELNAHFSAKFSLTELNRLQANSNNFKS